MRIAGSLLLLLNLATVVACGDDDGGGLTADADPNAPDARTDSADARPAGNLALNEIFAGGDPAGAYPTDWAELVNNTGNPIDLSGFHLTDDEAAPTLGTFLAGTTIPANGHLEVDLADLEPFPFKLKAGGELLILLDAQGQLVDRVDWSADQAGSATLGVSFGRSPDGTGAFTTLNTPTPGAANVPN
jgi:hypothetical protein